MRCYLMLTGTLLSVAAAFAQQPGVNIVPQEALNSAFRRALVSPLRQPRNNALFLRPAPVAKICAIPLLEAKGIPTNDRIARPGRGPEVDPKMVLAPPVPACPSLTPRPR